MAAARISVRSYVCACAPPSRPWSCQSRSQKLRSFCSSPRITNLSKNPKKKTYLIGRKTYSSYANYFANHTNCEHVDLILTSHLGTHQFYTTVKEKVYLNTSNSKKPRHNDILSKISFVLLLKVVQCHFLKHACY